MKPAAVLIFCVVMVGVLLTGCGGKADYSEVIEVNERYIDLLESYVGKLDDAGDAASVADAMHELADGLEELIPQMKAVMGKYPELKNRDQQPERVRELTRRAAEVAQEFMGSMRKVMPYMNDPAVQEAQARIGQVWQQS